MSNVLILGAGGQIARHVIGEAFCETTPEVTSGTGLHRDDASGLLSSASPP